MSAHRFMEDHAAPAMGCLVLFLAMFWGVG